MQISNDKPRVLLLMTPTTYRAADFLNAAAAAGVDIVVGTNLAQTLAGLAPGHNLTLPFDEPDVAVARARAFAAGHPVQAVVGVDDEAVLTAARVAEALQVPHNSLGAVAASRSKALMRASLAAAMETPAFVAVDQCPEAEWVTEQVGFPCVIKPAALSGSRGVLRLDRPEQVKPAWEQVAAIMMEARQEGRQGVEDLRVLFEAFMPGTEVAVEGLLEDGRLRLLALLDKPAPMNGPTFAETLFITPSRHPRRVQVAIRESTARAAAVLGLQEGPVHAEFRVHRAKPVLLEMAPRTIGGLCSRILRFGTGMSLEEIVLRRACGLELPSLSREMQAAGVFMVPVTSAGRLQAVHGIAEAAAVAGMEDVVISIPVGEMVRPLPEESRPLGFLFARGATPAAVEASLHAAHACLDVDIEPVRS